MIVESILIGLAAQVLPGIVGALGGAKAKEVTEAIVGAGTQIFGAGADKASIAKQVATNPALLDQFKLKLQQDLELRKVDLEEYRISVADTADARARDVAIRAQGDGNPRANVMLAGNFACIIAITMGLLFYRQSMPDGIAAILGALIGNLATMLTQAFNFEFGSSRGSSEKTNQLTEMLSRQK